MVRKKIPNATGKGRKGEEGPTETGAPQRNSSRITKTPPPNEGERPERRPRKKESRNSVSKKKV